MEKEGRNRVMIGKEGRKEGLGLRRKEGKVTMGKEGRKELG